MLGHLGYGKATNGPVPIAVSATGRLLLDEQLLLLLSQIGAPLPEGTDRSGSIATAGLSQQLAPGNVTRRGLDIQNISSGDLWVNEAGGSAVPGVAGSWRIQAGQSFSIATNREVTIVGAVSGQAWSATEY